MFARIQPGSRARQYSWLKAVYSRFRIAGVGQLAAFFVARMLLGGAAGIDCPALRRPATESRTAESLLGKG